jgi:hypothetical protein
MMASAKACDRCFDIRILRFAVRNAKPETVR